MIAPFPHTSAQVAERGRAPYDAARRDLARAVLDATYREGRGAAMPPGVVALYDRARTARLLDLQNTALSYGASNWSTP